WASCSSPMRGGRKGSPAQPSLWGVRRGMAAVAILVALGVGAPTAAAETVQVDPGLEWTTIVWPQGSMRINVLAVAPARVHGVLSNDRIGGRERVSRMGRRVQAVAGVNGGHFKASGDPVGALAIDGRLLSEPIDGRTGLILGAGAPPTGSPPSAARPLIAPLRFRGRVSVNGRSREIDGIDRPRGVIPAC